MLVLRGEAGIGKTALLDFAAECAQGFRTARVSGVESEMELAFAALHQLCAPLLDFLPKLPAPQREALEIAFGRSAGSAPDRFLVGLAVLNLIGSAAKGKPMLFLVDDAQWIDRVSAQTLAFVARRLVAEPVCLVFAIRGGFPDDELTGLPELTVQGLNPGDARALLDSAVLGRLDNQVRDRIVAETRGNPLALLELPKGLTTEELAGGFGPPDARPLAGQIEHTFLRRIERLSGHTQQLLLTAAAEPIGDAALLMRAAELLGLPHDAAAGAQAAGLIDMGTTVRFRHPLVRSAAYRAAGLMERRRAHQALAEATDATVDPDRRAWHLAIAATGPDEAVAVQLELSAERAQARGGVAAAAAFLERATQLTADPVRRAARALAAAQAKRDTAAFDAADELLRIAESGAAASLDDLQRARLTRLRAQIAFARSRSGDADAPTVSDSAVGLLDAARQLATLDVAQSRETYLEAVGAALFGGRLCPHGGIRMTAAAARAAPPGPHPLRAVDLLLNGIAIRATDGHAAGLATLRDALALISAEAEGGGADVMRWFWQAFPIVQESAAHELWDDEVWHQLATHAVRLARDAGALAVLPLALVYRAGVHVQAGEFTAATALIEEADAITAATGYAPVKYHSVLLAALRGNESDALRLIESAHHDGVARGEGRVVGLTNFARAVLYNGLGRYEEAFTAAAQACQDEDLGLFGWCLIELIEAGVRSGDTQAARDALAELEQRARNSGTDWAAGVLARSQALLADDGKAETLYREAIVRLGNTRIAVQLARAHLVYGEWLRRCSRRVDARTQLHTAHEMFSGMGAEAFAERARRELLVTGRKVSKRSTAPAGELTAQEAQIAKLAGDGLTNSEIAAQLFISTHTVEWHLRKVFAKLGIKSRRQLRNTATDSPRD